MLAAALVAGRALFAAPLPSGHDAIYYLPRHVEFLRALTDGVAVPRWAADFGGGYGQPLFEFTPPLFYYLTAGAHALGLSLSAASAAAALTLLVAAAFAMYVLAREFFGSVGGVIAATAYVLSPYFLVTIFVRYAMGDFAAFALMPLALWGVVRFALRGEPLMLLTGAAGTAGLLLSSNHVALMTVPVIALAGAVATFATGPWTVMARAVGPLLLGLGSSAFFWLPALAEREFVYVGRAVKGVYEYGFHFLEPKQLLYSPWGYGGSVAGPDDGFSLSLGPLQLVLATLAMLTLPWAWRRSRRAGLATLIAALVLLGTAFMTTNAARPIWDALPLLQYLQFPWRFLSLATLAAALLAGGVAVALRPLGRWPAHIAAAVIVAALCAQTGPNAVPPPPDYDLPDSLSPQNVVDWGLVGSNASEFEPMWVVQRPPAPADPNLTVLSGTAEVEPVRLASHVREFVATAAAPARLRLNTHYFPGWTLTVDGNVETVDFGSSAGLMEFELAPGRHIVRLAFEDSSTRATASVISGVSVVLLVALSVALWWRRRLGQL